MKSQEILQSISPDLVEEIFTSIHRIEKASYRSLLETLASRKKLRTIYLERKPRVERHLWMRDELIRPSNLDMADQVLQVWLLSDSQPMICAFLDTLGIVHDGKGLVDDLPGEPEPAKVHKAVQVLLKDYDARKVAIYLHFFADMADSPWPELQRLLASEERLKLSEPHTAQS
ncbi:MAG: hypothetical protein ABIP97_11630 [Chthoniobacterales bacterium]